MMRQPMILLLLLTAVSLVHSQDVDLKPPADARDLIGQLNHGDRQMRQNAATKLKSGAAGATAHLVAAILDRSSGQLMAARAAAILIDRSGVELTKEDQHDLLPLASFIGQSTGEPWRWYLAATVLDELQPALLTNQMAALHSALRGSNSMRRYAALRAVFHLGKSASSAKATLLDLLSRPMPPMQGVYLRYDLPIVEDQVAYTADLRVYVKQQDGDFPNRNFYQYYGDSHLLVSDALLAMGANFSDIGDQLVRISNSRIQSVKFHAARQLLKLGAQGQAAAATTLNELLSDPSGSWIEQAAEEHANWTTGGATGRNFAPPATIQSFRGLGDAARRVVPSVAKLLENRDVRVRHFAADTLRYIGAADKETALPALAKAIASEQKLGGPALEAMSRAFGTIERDKKSQP